MSAASVHGQRTTQPEREALVTEIAESLILTGQLWERVDATPSQDDLHFYHELADSVLRVIERPQSSLTETFTPCNCGQNGYPPNSSFSNHPHLLGCPYFDESDLLIESVSRPRGGQHVGVSCAVRLAHIPSGIIVECNEHRSQLLNKEEALKVLMEKVRQEYNAPQLPTQGEA